MGQGLNFSESSILVVDDESGIRRLLELELRTAGFGNISVCGSAEEAINLYRAHRYDLVLLDLHMPGRDGYEVMAAMKEMEPEGYLPVLVVTADPEAKTEALRAGARDFISKPFNRPELLTRVKNLLEVRLLYKELRDYAGELEHKVTERTKSLTGSYHETLRTMTRAAEYRDDNTGAHVRRISIYSRELAAAMGMDTDFCEQIFHASPLHDIGKIGIPDSILLKKGPLSPRQWNVMRKHAMIGARMLLDSQSPYLRMGAQIAAAHHERWDGTGYPDQLKGEEIPLPARLMAVCDVYDALRSARPYKPALPHDTAVKTVLEGDGRTEPSHFDPAVLDAFSRSVAMFRDIYTTNEELPTRSRSGRAPGA